MRRTRSYASLLVLLLLLAAALMPGGSIHAQPGPVPIAYVYNTNVSFANDFKATLELRGFSVALVTLTGAESFDFTKVTAIIIGDDTGVEGPTGAAWLGSAAARAAITRAERKTIGFGVGGSTFFDAVGVTQLGYSSTTSFSNAGAYAVSPGDAIWTTPNPIAIAIDAFVKLYGLPTPGRALFSASGVNPLGQLPAVEIPIFPLASDSIVGQQQTYCNVLWGFRRQPAAMTVAGRDLLENMLRSDPCAPQARPADISLVKTDSSDPATVGQNLTYTLTIANAGPAPAPNTRVEDVLPADVTFVSVTPSQGSCVRLRGRIRCNLGTIASGGSATVAIVVKPTEAGKANNVAWALSNAPDPNMFNNTASEGTTFNQPSTFNPLLALPYRPIFTAQIPFFPTEDLSIHGIEITQGIQCFDTTKGLASCADNSLRMVARKTTTARIYLKYTGPALSKNNVPVRLVLIDVNNVEYPVNLSGKALPAIDQSSASNSANVFFTVNFNSTVPVRYYAIVDPNGAYAETNESNNRFPAIGTRSINFAPSRTMKILGQRLRYHPSGYSGTQYAGGWAVNGGAADWFEQLLPIRNNGITYAVKSGYLNWTTSVGSSSGQHSLIQNLNTRWILENVFPFFFGGEYTGARHVYGWVPNGSGIGGHADMPVYPHAGGLGVVGIGNDNPGTSTDNPGSGALIFGHELVHDYDVKHTDVTGDCGSSDSSSTFPYSNASIQEYGFNTITGKVYDPAATHDLMSYCPAGGSKLGWISPFTWEAMFTRLTASSANAEAVGRVSTPGAALAVEVTVTNPALGPETGFFNSAAKIDANVPIITPQPGDYSVQLRDAGGATLQSTPFAVSFQSEYSAHEGDHPGDPSATAVASAQMSVPWVDGTASVVLLHGASILQSRSVSANAPAVQFTSPTTAQTWAAGTIQTLSWAASDPDPGTILTYSLFYSADGIEWDLIASDLTATSLAVEVDALAGSPVARFRVVANDGVNIGEDETNAPISVPDKLPNAVILNPGPGTQVPIGDLLVLQGVGNDLEDGTLPDLSLTWSSNVQGALGTGSILPVNGLQPGLHRITLTVVDGAGQTGQATTEVFIGARLTLPLIVAP